MINIAKYTYLLVVNVIIIHSRPRQNGQAHLNFLPVFIAERKNSQLQNPCYYHQVCGPHCVLQRLGFTGVLAVQPQVLTLSQAALSHPAISPGPFPSLSILHALLEKWWPSSKSEKPVTNEKKKISFFMFNLLFSNHNNQLKRNRLLAISPRDWSQTEKNRLCIAALAFKSASCE